MKQISNTNAGFDVQGFEPEDTRTVDKKIIRMKYTMNTVRTNSLRSCFRFSFLIAACLFLMAATSLSAQVIASAKQPKGTIEVKGLVRDANTKLPIAAAQIKALNNSGAATTDQQGNFTIKVVLTDEVLSVKAFDYAVREVPIKSKNQLVIDLYPEVFTPYYENQELVTGVQRNTTTVPAVKTISDFTLSQALSADEFIQSEVGGNVRSISRSGLAGIGSSLFIRGYNSLLSNSQPLYVVDGVIINNLYDVESLFNGQSQNTLLNLDNNDILSISVLKDGTSIYGSKGSNGVILIKTTRGKSMVTKINLNVTAGLTSIPKTTPVMNADDYRIYVSDIIGSAGYTPQQIAGMSFLSDDNSSVAYNKYHNNTNWNDEVYQQGVTQNYMLNINGGDEKALYYFSLGFTQNNGIVKSTDLSRISTRFNADINLSPDVKLGTGISYTNISKSTMTDGVDFYTSPTYLAYIKAPFLSPHTFTSYGYETVTNDDADEFGIGNPSGIISASMNYSKHHYFDLSMIPTWDINKNWNLSSQLSYTLNKYEENAYDPYLGVATRFFEGFGTSENRLRNQLVRNISVSDDTRLKFNKRFDALNQLNAIIGWRYISNTFETDYVEAHNSGSDDNTLIKSSYDFRQVRGLNNDTKSISNYAAFDYSYSNRYFLSAAIAIDGSSRFGNQTEGGFQLFGHSWGVFPSINGAWLVSSEPFLKDVSAIDLLKIRAGYGITGNDGIQDYANKAYFKSVRYLDKANGLVLANIGNNKLQWETTGRASAGIDLGLLNERLNLSFDVYSSKTSDLLIWKNLGDLAGLDSYLTNAGELSNKGYELSLNARLLNLKNVQWEIGASAGHYKNRIESLPNGDFKTSVYNATILSQVGQAAGVFYGYKTNGVFSTQSEADLANLKVLNTDGTYTNFGAGDIIFDDYESDGVIDEKDMQIIGDPNPDIYGSFNSRLTIKKLTINALFNYSLGNDVYNYLRSQLESGSTLSNQTTVMKSRWSYEEQDTNQPKATYGDPLGNARFSDRWIEDGSFLRLKTISLSYNIPIKNFTFISGLDIWVAANNLFTLTNYLGVDPEFSAKNDVLFQGIDAGLVPQTRSFFMGVKINL